MINNQRKPLSPLTLAVIFAIVAIAIVVPAAFVLKDMRVTTPGVLTLPTAPVIATPPSIVSEQQYADNYDAWFQDLAVGLKATVDAQAPANDSPAMLNDPRFLKNVRDTLVKSQQQIVSVRSWNAPVKYATLQGLLIKYADKTDEHTRLCVAAYTEGASMDTIKQCGWSFGERQPYMRSIVAEMSLLKTLK